MGSQELTVLWEMKQELAVMPDRDRERIEIRARAIRQIIKDNPGHGQFALIMIGAELAADSANPRPKG